ncbi:LOW QUALITY PROTEIN: olfactory receptor 2T3-like [Trichechus inunguis]
MCSGNQTSSTDFILTGLFSSTKHADLLCGLSFILFLKALTGNDLLILLIHMEPCLHTPMYFFISQLSLMDLMYICVTIPKTLMDQVMGDNAISPLGCGVQMFFYPTLAGAEFFLLAAMAYDQYAAICRPLHYPLLMNQRVCHLLVSGCWFLGTDGLLLTPSNMSFPFCQSRKIMNFFCEAPALLKLSSSDIFLYKTLTYLCCVLMLLIPVSIISTSYALTLYRIHRMISEGHRKALTTCSSHMVVVLLFFGASIYTYMLPRSYHTAEQDMMVSAFYTPVLNPLIYSLRDKDVTGALRSMMPSGMRLGKVVNVKT